MPELRYTLMRYGVAKLVRQGHSISTNSYLCAVADTTFGRDRYDAVVVLRLGINRSKFLIIDNDENKLFSSVKCEN